MKNFINLYLLEYGVNSLLRQKSKNIFIVIIFTTLVFLLSCVFFITSSIKYELNSTLDTLPQIIVQNMKAGRVCDINVDKIEGILGISGVIDATPRVWGYYYFEYLGVEFSVVGIDKFELQYKSSFQKIVDNFDLQNSIVVGNGVLKLMQEAYYKEYFNFIKEDGSIKKMNIISAFDGDTNLESNDMIVMSKENFREIFHMPKYRATDIVVRVLNENEIDTVALKIKSLYPSLKIITKEDLKVSYQNIFNYKSGVFLAFFIMSIFTFFIIIYDKVSGITSEEKKEIGILKAIGWRVEDILIEKFYESFLLSFISYTVGVGLALFFVYILQAPILREVFVSFNENKPDFELLFIFDIQTLSLIFLLSVPIYIAATIIPSWRVATLEADELIR